MGAITRCLVVGAMPVAPELADRIATFAPQLIIAADGGYLRCAEMGLTPDLVLGDFDSAPEPESDAVVYPVHKDDTDCMLALREGAARGATDFLLLGCTGGRLDHTFAAVQSLGWLAERGLRGELADGQHRLRLLRGGERLDIAAGCLYFSLFALGECCTGVTITGAEYPLLDHTLTNCYPLGVSNKVAGATATVTVATGLLLVVLVEKED